MYGFDKGLGISTWDVDATSGLEPMKGRNDVGLGVGVPSVGSSSEVSESHSGISDGQWKRCRRKLEIENEG